MRSLRNTGTHELGKAAEPFLDRHVALLLINHGARILLVACAVGGVNRLTRDQIDALEWMRGNPSHGQIDHGY
jgi:hypothetical protein